MKTNYLSVKIKEPYWGAWKKYGWKEGTWGIGINSKQVEKAIKNNQTLKISVWKFKTTYTIDPNKVKSFALENNCKYRAKLNTILYMISESELQES